LKERKNTNSPIKRDYSWQRKKKYKFTNY